MELKTLLGKRIRELRKKNKLTLEKLSEMIGIDYKNLGNIELGHSYPSSKTLENLAIALNVIPKELFNFEHLQESNDLEQEIVRIFRKQETNSQQLIYKLIKAFDS